METGGAREVVDTGIGAVEKQSEPNMRTNNSLRESRLDYPIAIDSGLADLNKTAFICWVPRNFDRSAEVTCVFQPDR